MDNCIFCKIIKGEIPTHALYENEFVIAFPDIHPEAPGHTLVIPKDHHKWFYEIPGNIANEWFSAAQMLALKLKEEYRSDYVELKIIGIDIPHAHIHLIPRKKSI
ncbi:MAG: HIT domain-containing protein [Nanoarchaeota archaeon]|nr:HIT domain-containing protein [Nanoarchaeota archaeon]